MPKSGRLPRFGQYLPLISYTMLVLFAFAANSLLCRLALTSTMIDPTTFSSLRLMFGALTLWIICFWRQSRTINHGSWAGATALFVYVVGFSFAYLYLAAGTGTLILFGAVQLTMIVAGLLAGERFSAVQIAGLLSAVLGLVILVFPGLQSPTLIGALLMSASGMAWGLYSLLGRNAVDPIASTASNFLRATPMAIALSLFLLPGFKVDAAGVFCAILSGSLASGIGYVLWYQVLREMKVIDAALVQMVVPLLTAAGGAMLLDEPITRSFIIAAVLMLGGIWLAMAHQQKT